MLPTAAGAGCTGHWAYDGPYASISEGKSHIAVTYQRTDAAETSGAAVSRPRGSGTSLPSRWGS